MNGYAKKIGEINLTEKLAILQYYPLLTEIAGKLDSYLSNHGFGQSLTNILNAKGLLTS